ncbi:MAG: hypothetical protein GXO74_16190 [Calditrichaeota bacterium]|nr:hypothetical protein [Calditrichota bacterium]
MKIIDNHEGHEAHEVFLKFKKLGLDLEKWIIRKSNLSKLMHDVYNQIPQKFDLSLIFISLRVFRVLRG